MDAEITNILRLYKFIDWLINLPEELGKKFHEEIVKYEKEKKMPYITTAERESCENRKSTIYLAILRG